MASLSEKKLKNGVEEGKPIKSRADDISARVKAAVAGAKRSRSRSRSRSPTREHTERSLREETKEEKKEEAKEKSRRDRWLEELSVYHAPSADGSWQVLLYLSDFADAGLFDETGVEVAENILKWILTQCRLSSLASRVRYGEENEGHLAGVIEDEGNTCGEMAWVVCIPTLTEKEARVILNKASKLADTAFAAKAENGLKRLKGLDSEGEVSLKRIFAHDSVRAVVVYANHYTP